MFESKRITKIEGKLETFDKAFEHMDEAFAKMNKMFEKLPDLIGKVVDEQEEQKEQEEVEEQNENKSDDNVVHLSSAGMAFTRNSKVQIALVSNNKVQVTVNGNALSWTFPGKTEQEKFFNKLVDELKELYE